MDFLKNKDFILQLDWRNKKFPKMGAENWVTLYQSERKEDVQDLTLFSALIPSNKNNAKLQTPDWDIFIGMAQPSIVTHYEDGQEIERYEHFTMPDSTMPIVLVRQFHGIKPHYFEILEEFRLFHNLYHDVASNTYFKFQDNGDEDEVIRVTENKVEARLKEIKQFLAFKDMYLALYFDILRFSTLKLSEIGEDDKLVEATTDNMNYKFFVTIDDFSTKSGSKTFSRLRGKKLIPPMPKEETGIPPYDSPREFEDFIIAVDENGNEITFSANPEHLANFFGKNRGNPYYLTPVFFRRDVLSRYFNNPEKYTVQDSYLQCAGFWSLRMDNNHPKYVIVYLGDLGSLPYSEQRVWRSYNIAPDGYISDVAYRRGILAEWAEASADDLVFKSQFQEFQKNWFNVQGWHIFKPLNEQDEHHFTALHIPITNGNAEFDEQVISLTKLLIDSLNETKLKKLIKTEIDKSIRGIIKLELFLQQEKMPHHEKQVLFLRQLQKIRSISAAHRKSSKYEKEMKKLDVDLDNLPLEFRKLLKDASSLLESLSQYFLA